MATCGRGGIDMDTINSLTPSLPDTFLRRVFHKNTGFGGMALLWDERNLAVLRSRVLVILPFSPAGYHYRRESAFVKHSHFKITLNHHFTYTVRPRKKFSVQI